MAKDYSEKMEYHPTNVNSIQFEHDYCLNHLVQHNNNNKNINRLNRFGKKFDGNISAVDKWAASIVLRAPTGDDSKRNVEREISILKVKCPFLPEQQIRGKVYKKFGFPTVMGGLSSRGSSFVGGSSSKKRSKSCKGNTGSTKNLKKILTTRQVSKRFKKFWNERATPYDDKSLSIRSNEDLRMTLIDYVIKVIDGEASDHKILDYERFVNPTMLDKISIEYEPAPFLASDHQLYFRRVTGPVSSHEISMNPEGNSCSPRRIVPSPKNNSCIGDLNGNIIQENGISSLKLKGRKRKINTELFPDFVGTDEISGLNHLGKMEDKLIEEDRFIGPSISVRQLPTRNITRPDTRTLDYRHSKQKYESHYIVPVSKSRRDGKDVQFTNNENNYKRACVASKEFVSGHTAMINRNYEGKGSRKEINNCGKKEKRLNSEPRDDDFLNNKENELPEKHSCRTILKRKNVQIDCHKNAQIRYKIAPVSQVNRSLLENSSNNERIEKPESPSKKKPCYFYSDRSMLPENLKKMKNEYEPNGFHDCGKNSTLELANIIEIRKKDLIPKSLAASTNNDNITIRSANLIPCRSDIPTFIVVDPLSNHCCEYDQHFSNISGFTSFVHNFVRQSSSSLRDSPSVSWQELTEAVEGILKFLDVDR